MSTTTKRTVNSAAKAGVEIPRLEGWWTLDEAGAHLGLTRNGMAFMVFSSQRFNFEHDVRVVGTQNVYLLRITAVEAVKSHRDAEARLAAQERLTASA